MRLCYYCEGSGYLIHRCPEKPSSAQVALIDSGAAVNLIDRALVEELRISTVPCMPSLRITAIDSQPIGGGYFTHQTELLDLKAAAGFFFVGKKDGGLCPCIDYRGLNAITVCYPYPLPLVPAALKQLRGARFFTKLDLCSAYNLVRIQEEDKWKTAFHTTHGHYEYLVMPFGLTNAPVVFQSLINEVFQDIPGKWVIAYIDDILVYSISLEEHVRHIRATLYRLQQNHLYVKPEKCVFHWTTITFLGYMIPRQGVKMDLTKVRAITEWPNPTTIKELQWFLGFANFYRHFIQNYSSVAGPLTSLLQGKPRRLSWSDQAQAAFVKLKDSFTTAPILHHPDPDLPLVKLMAAGVNYEVGNRELLSIKVLFFTRFEFTVTYLPGTKNSKADLSRQFEAQGEPSQPDLIFPAAAILAPVWWSLIEEIQRAHADEPPPVNCPSTKVYVPLQFRQQVLQWVHEAPSSSHPGILRSTQLTLRRFWWPSLRTDVE
ncbi:hypothetical protein QTP70_003633 [Hemibagrus guttatus]|uniref:Gypsy retrotransposon integrase-like protein 1 n=1 Tax=Hemibagrus guttatus TaxID=175788 RepID=A0AAE0QS21_9TELE|nr:hypothetical protein QTP70_003633 [Hemibagrus guttatus]